MLLGINSSMSIMIFMDAHIAWLTLLSHANGIPYLINFSLNCFLTVIPRLDVLNGAPLHLLGRLLQPLSALNLWL